MPKLTLTLNKFGYMFWHEGQLIYNGKYKIEQCLGYGGFAITYQALHLILNRHVVIKTPNISIRQDPDYPKYVERFKKEARMLAKCCKKPHPHIVQVFDFFESNDCYCLAMQYVAGTSLWQYVQNKRRLAETEAVNYIRQVGSALVEVHKQGVMHLDVTPPNIMLSFDSPDPNSGNAVLIDFGIAADMSPPSTLSRTFGNKAFAPYELIYKGIRHSTVDVYCLAGSLYYAITGQRPTNSFNRKYEQQELVPPKQLVPSLSDAVNEAILQGMELEAEKRPQTMAKWLNLLPFSSTGREIRIVIESNTTQSKSASYLDRKYQNLENLLKAKQWKDADQETALLMLKIADREQEGWLDYESIENFPCSDLEKINQMWIKYSDEHFGFTVQKDIWLNCGGKVDWETEYCIDNCVGWRKNGIRLSYDDYDFSLNAPRGHLPSKIFDNPRRSSLNFTKIYLLYGTSSVALRLVNCNM